MEGKGSGRRKIVKKKADFNLGKPYTHSKPLDYDTNLNDYARPSDEEVGYYQGLIGLFVTIVIGAVIFFFACHGFYHLVIK